MSYIDITSYSGERNKDWSYTDKAGHIHVWLTSPDFIQDNRMRAGVWKIPTCEYIVERESDIDLEISGKGYYECKLCGERIYPVDKPASGFREYFYIPDF